MGEICRFLYNLVSKRLIEFIECQDKRGAFTYKMRDENILKIEGNAKEKR